MGESSFFEKADLATRKKVEFVMKYFGIYFRIVCSTLKNGTSRIPNIIYIDPFSGPGIYDDGYESVPIKLLKFIRNQGIENIRFIFNDIEYSGKLKENIHKNIHLLPNVNSITILDKDANLIDFSSYFTPKDVVISYVDPFSYTRVDPLTIKQLTNNAFSDSLFFLNIQYFYRFIEVDADNLKSFFGNLDIYSRVKQSIKNDTREQSTNLLIHEYANALTKNSNRFILPIFFKKSHKETQIFNAILLVSKCKTGLDRIKEYICGEEHFFIEDGRFIIYESSYSQIEEFDIFNSREESILQHIPKTDFINCDKLIEIIDKHFIVTYGYISAYNPKYVKKVLSDLEDNNQIMIRHDGKRNRIKRNGINTYGENTFFKKE